MNIEEDLLAVKRIFVSLPKKLEKLNEELVEIGSERQDLLHALELGKLDAVRMSKIAKSLQDVQRRRRKIKDEIEVLEEVIQIVNGNRIKENEIDRVFGRVKYVKEKQENRSYAMRVRKDLQELVDTK